MPAIASSRGARHSNTDGSQRATPCEPAVVLSPPAFAVPRDVPPGRGYRIVVGCAIVLGLAFIVLVTLDGQLLRFVMPWVAAANWSSTVLPKAGMIWLSLGLSMLVVRTLLWFGYRPCDRSTHGSAPAMTVIIPAYNEGAMVERSIASVALARYPRQRLEVIVVDDGSTDDTWTCIQRAVKRHPGLVTALKLEHNQGKRVALATGFRAAHGAILVTVDSDSVIEANALLAIAGPFQDPRVGAVAGKVAAYNRDQGMISRMLHVRYVLAFDLQRRVQSTYRTVYCCPGALSAYRASVIAEIIEPWLLQRFLGVPCTYGEDRALTNAILARGFDTVYQGSAVVRTLVPNSYAGLCRMYLRWDRSYVREEISFARIVWKRPLVPMLFGLVERVIANLGVPLSWIGIAMLAAIVPTHPAILARILLALGAGAAFSMLYYLYTDKSLRFVHGVIYAYFSFFTLWWIFPYAIMTVRSRSWMTR